VGWFGPSAALLRPPEQYLATPVCMCNVCHKVSDATVLFISDVNVTFFLKSRKKTSIFLRDQHQDFLLKSKTSCSIGWFNITQLNKVHMLSKTIERESV